MKTLWDAIKRTLALIGTEVAMIMAASSAMNVAAWKAAVISAIAAALSVWAAIGRAYYKDGKLTEAEVDEAFSDK
jgi:hypothetical protein